MKRSIKETKPTNQFLFDEVLKILQEEKKLPNILEYSSHSNKICSFSDYKFDAGYRLDYGSNEGIYLDCFVEGICDETENVTRIHIGTFKTLNTSDEAMITMGILAGNMTIVLKKFVNGHLDDFTWKGYDVDFYKDNGDYACGYTCGTEKIAASRAEEYKSKYAKATLRNNSTRENLVIKDELLQITTDSSSGGALVLSKSEQYNDYIVNYKNYNLGLTDEYDMMALLNMLEANGETLESLLECHGNKSGFCGIFEVNNLNKHNSDSEVAKAVIHTNAFFISKEAYLEWEDDEEEKEFRSQLWDDALEQGYIVSTTDGFVELHVV